MTSRTIPKLLHAKVYVDDADKEKPGLQLGLFARRDLRKGEVIFVCKGTLRNLIIKTKADSEKYPNAIGVKRNYWLDPHPDNPLPYLNHSCEPNAGVKGSVTIVARKNIKQGEHVTIDYSTTECDERWTLDAHCKCGSNNCRGVIKSIQSLPKITYNKYLPYIGKAFQREYRKANS